MAILAVSDKHTMARLVSFGDFTCAILSNKIAEVAWHVIRKIW
jgi:hypothetical protein